MGRDGRFVAAKKPAKTAAKKSAPKAAPKAPPKAAPKATAKTTAAPAAAAPAPAPTPAPAPSAAPAASRDAIYPIVDRSPWGIVALVLGIIGLGGVGTIIAGAISKQHMARDIIFGILQLVPIVGQAWGLVWGILIFVKGNK